MKIGEQELSFEQECAVLAGLRLLADSLARGQITPNDGGVGNLLTNCGDHDALTAEQVQALGDQLVGQPG